MTQMYSAGKATRRWIWRLGLPLLLILLILNSFLAVWQVDARIGTVDLAAVNQAIATAQRALLSRQNADGYWSGLGLLNSPEFPDALGVTATYLLITQQLGVENASTQRALEYLLASQRGDGGYGDPNANFGVLLALEQSGIAPGHPAIERLQRHIEEMGQTIDQTLPYIQLFWAQAGHISWEQVYYGEILRDYQPDAAPERIPIMYYRDQAVSLSILKTLHQGRPLTPGQLQSVKMSEWFLIQRQLPDGSWFSYIGATTQALSALTELGYPVNHPVIKKGLEFLETLQKKDGSIALFKVPTWDTAVALMALHESGIRLERPEVQRAAQWLVDARFPQGAWGFTPAAGVFVDYDDTGLALAALGAYTPIHNRDPISFTLERQYEDGGWGTFYQREGDPKGPLGLKWVPANKFTGVWWDPSVPDVTAHVLFGLARNGYSTKDPSVAAAVQYLKDVQFSDGKWFAWWGVPYIYGTSNVLAALEAVGEDMQAPYVRKAVAWLTAQQNNDGGWGEDIAAMSEGPLQAGLGDSTATQTAWALLGLLAAGEPVDSPTITGGVQYLLKRQRPDGTWPLTPTMAVPGVAYSMQHDHVHWELWSLAKYRQMSQTREVWPFVLGNGVLIALVVLGSVVGKFRNGSGGGKE